VGFPPINSASAALPPPPSGSSSGSILTGGLPAVAGPFLDTIAAKESDGKYNTRYTPKGDVPFEEGREHPNIPEKTPDGRISTAAGKYQITKETWDDLTKKYPDLQEEGFTRDNQDRAAWLLANDRYKARTRGRDLTTDLQSGRTGNIETALKPTWTGGAIDFEKRFRQTVPPLPGRKPAR
jgi:muramidase (phage lysozyme)